MGQAGVRPVPLLALKFLIAAACLGSSAALNNGLALTPQMGYAPWNAFGVNVNETLIKETADRLISTGLAELGYTYLAVDDAWAEKERVDGRMVGNKQTFPSGMKALGDYIHDKGLLFGIYSDAGTHTCDGYPGSIGFEKEDAEDFASWGVDYLKYDNCYCNPEDPVEGRYAAMRDALNATGRPILYAMVSRGMRPLSGAALLQVGNSWRTTADIAPNWDAMLRCLDNTVGLSRFAGPGHWNDPDMLEVGVGMSLPEQRSHFALWALLKAPLIIGADLRRIDDEALGILKARELVAVNQDGLGVAGDLLWKEGPLEVYGAPISGGARAVILFNRHTPFPLASKITVNWHQLGYPAEFKATVRDLYAEKDLGVYQEHFTATVDPHDVCAVLITPHIALPYFDKWRPWHRSTASTENAANIEIA
ncbi:hypothetical protein WJX73_003682 [Symbiochloris irregularis]|uniref:Alpha-galactosidase n=1 Tax=Symbiochloris irregularis TaxID=706552 RepID=A0AAW1NUL2_9CHLO